MPKKFYAVLNGKDGPYCVYADWNRTSLAIKGLKGCRQKSFFTITECVTWLNPDGGSNDVQLLLTCYKKPTIPKRERHVYTDGGCVDNGTEFAAAGVGVHVDPDDPDNANHIALPLPGEIQTNNRAELFALLLGILSTSREDDVVIHTDSKYSINAVTQWYPSWVQQETGGWTKTENWDLIHLVAVALTDRPNVRLEYVKAHCGIEGNESADRLATRGIEWNKRRQKIPPQPTQKRKQLD